MAQHVGGGLHAQAWSLSMQRAQGCLKPVLPLSTPFSPVGGSGVAAGWLHQHNGQHDGPSPRTATGTAFLCSASAAAVPPGSPHTTCTMHAAGVATSGAAVCCSLGPACPSLTLPCLCPLPHGCCAAKGRCRRRHGHCLPGCSLCGPRRRHPASIPHVWPHRRGLSGQQISTAQKNSSERGRPMPSCHLWRLGSLWHACFWRNSCLLDACLGFAVFPVHALLPQIVCAVSASGSLQ